jgi:transposase InsO family protein
VAPNLIERDFSPVFPKQIRTTHITYLNADEGWLYLTVMLYLFNRQLVGWSIQTRMTQKLVVDALRMAWFRRRPQRGLIMHSDRRSQYCSKLFQTALKESGMQSSISRKADCWDNAPTESSWGSLKRVDVYRRRFTTREQA